MKHLRSVKDINLKGQRVFLRTDYNVVVDGKVIDEFRIEASLPTIRYLLKQDCSIVLASHNGRPDGKAVKSMSLEPVVAVLRRLLGREVAFAHDCVGKVAHSMAADLKSGEILLLENLRFHAEEEANDTTFARALASLAEVYVDDAFANVHREHASMVGVPKYLPSCAGLLVEREYDTLMGLLDQPKRPLLAIIAGAKVSTKLEVLHNLIGKVDTLVIGGAMANTFLLSRGYDMGKSVLETDLVGEADKVLHQAHLRGVEVILPTDLVVAAKPEPGQHPHVVALDAVGGTDMVLDIGPDSVEQIETAIRASKTVFWNGTVGFAEVADFAKASRAIAKCLGKASAHSIIGGGDTASFIDHAHMQHDFDFISTGGGASLELIAGKKLKALTILQD